MAPSSSDDEAEPAQLSVSNYYLVDDKDAPVSFHVLPIEWSKGERQKNGKEDKLYLKGSADLPIYKHVIAWKFDLSNVKPEIAVLSKEGDWIVLQKPRKSYEEIIRPILITVRGLGYLKRNPEASGKSVWDYLAKIFSMYQVRPSHRDLAEHAAMIYEAAARDDALGKSKFIVQYLQGKSTKKNLPDEDIQATAKPGFIVDDDEVYMIDDEDESNDDEDNLFDSVCAFCDNGGELLCCEGRCLRSFHPTVEDGVDSMCKSLGFIREEVNDMPNFFCKNCQYKQHQCFACGKLGSSDKSSGAEVFPCVSATCGQFYHPRCVAQLIYQDNGLSVEELEEKISLGESFTCPIHKCFHCKQGENKKDPELRFAVCRRCPKSYHRKCLPSEIHFEKTEVDEGEDEEEEDEETRAWEGLLPNRILIYCIEHEIDEKIGTPVRNHVRFPYADENKTTVMKNKTLFEEKKRRLTSEFIVVRENSMLKKRKLSTVRLSEGRTVPQVSEQKMTSHAKLGGSRTNEKVPSGVDVSKQVRINATSKKEVKTSVGKKSLGDKLFKHMKESGSVKFGKQGTPDGVVNSESEKTAKVRYTPREINVRASLDPARERRLCALMKDASSSITLEEVIRKHQVPSTHKSSNRHAVDRNITLGKVEGSVEAVRTALKKLQQGCSFEDAQAVCAPEVLHQIYKWKNKLTVYLAPFLHGMRYTSFGRHFTTVEKLEEIADRLHWYVQDGDMIVDFCCGSNDFSIIMKKKLEETGKKCQYKNYDIIQPKNDFCFEKRDWMTVKTDELPPGKKLIMGLNPPFGVKAALANQFIDKALQFQPKLLILIVPPETQRLNLKRPSPYDLMWEHERCLAGKSFYLPGSVDENDKQMEQWNVTAPPLYLWSRPDFSTEHKAIAQKVGHSSMLLGSMEDGCPEFLDHAVGDNDQCGETVMVIDDHPAQTDCLKDFVGEAVASKELTERSFKGSDDRGNHISSGQRKNRVNETGDKKKHGRGLVELSSDKSLYGGNVYVSEIQKERSPSTELGGKGDRYFEPSSSGSNSQVGTTYGRTVASTPEDTSRNFAITSNERYSSVAHRQSTGAITNSYRDTNSMEPGMVYTRGLSDTCGYKFSMEIAEPLRGEYDIRAQLPLYGQQDSVDSRNNFLGGQELVYRQVGSFPSAYGHTQLDSAVDSSYRMNMSAMQRYAPRLDELNYARTSALGSQPALGYDPRMYSSNLHGPNAPQPGGQGGTIGFARGSNLYDPRAPQPGGQGGTFGFAPGPYRSFSNQHSAGWLDD